MIVLICFYLHQQHAPTLGTFMAPTCRMTQSVGYGATSTPLYAKLVMVSYHRSGAHHTTFLRLPAWPRYQLFNQYLTQTTRDTGNLLPDKKDSTPGVPKTTPYPIAADKPYTPTGSKREPVSPATGPVPPLANPPKPPSPTTG